MRTVSAEFSTAAAATIRHPRVKVDILWTDPFVLSGNSVATTDYNRVGDVGQDYFATGSWHDPHLIDTVITTPHKYTILDGTFLLDGTYYLAPGNTEEAVENQFGWYSATLADGSGDFSPDPEATVTFGSVRAIRQIVVVGEPTLGQYPTEFDIFIYDVSAVQLFTGTYVGTAVETLIDLTSEAINDAKSMKIVIKSWSAINTVSKITEFFGTIGDTFYGDDVVLLSILEEREVSTGTLPIGNVSSNEMDLELQNIKIVRSSGEEVVDPMFPDNPDSYISASITPNVRITPYLGFRLPDLSIEYVKMGVFWSNDWNIDEDAFSASVTARDRLDLLRSVEFLQDDIPVDYTLKDLAEYVLNAAKVRVPMNDLEWSIDPELDNYVIPLTWFGKLNYMECLSNIAEACMGHVYMKIDDSTGNDIVRIESFKANEAASVDYTITRDDYYKRSQPINSSSLKNKVIVEISPLVLEAEASDIKTTDDISFGVGVDDIDDYSIEWGYDAITDGDATVTDEDGVTVTIPTKTFYPWGCVLSFHKTSGTSGTFKVKITGKRLINVEPEEYTDEDVESIRLYGKKEYRYGGNFLIQESGIASTIASSLLTSYANPRRDANFEIPGNPAHEIGDTVTAPVYTLNTTGVSIFNDFLTYRQYFTYDGALQCKIDMRKAVTY